MSTEVVYIRNMVCGRCVKAVHELLHNSDLPLKDVGMGEVTFKRPLTDAERKQLRAQMHEEGFEVIDDRKARLVEQIKQVVRTIIMEPEKHNLRQFTSIIAQELHQDYSHLSAQFSAHEHITVERFFILMKIEKVKELLVYDELTLSQIAYRLGYSNVHHLSAQFKKVTGMTPTQFKSMMYKHRVGYDEVGDAGKGGVKSAG